MTLSDLLTALQDDLGYDAIPSASVTRRLTKYLNEGYRHILSMNEMGPLRSITLPFASVAGQALYGLPQAIQQIDTLVNSTQNVRLRLMTLDEFRALDPQETSSGTPTHYVPMGLSAVARQPNSTPVWAVGSTVSDTRTVTVHGIDANGLSPFRNSVSLTGITPVQVGPEPNIIFIQQFEVASNVGGYLALLDGPIGTPDTILGLINLNEYSSHYQMIRLWPTPSAADAYLIDGSTNINDLAGTDTPLIPLDFQYILADYARMREYEFRDDSRFPMAQMRYEQKLKQMRDRIQNPPDYRPRAGKLSGRIARRIWAVSTRRGVSENEDANVHDSLSGGIQRIA